MLTGTAFGHLNGNCANWFECRVCMGVTGYRAGRSSLTSRGSFPVSGSAVSPLDLSRQGEPRMRPWEDVYALLGLQMPVDVTP